MVSWTHFEKNHKRETIMKFELPANHGLSAESVDSLVFREGDEYSLTDVQYATLDAGVGRGESVLIVSPTSTGKTQIALWAVAHGLENNCRTVYLLTHRALALYAQPLRGHRGWKWPGVWRICTSGPCSPRTGCALVPSMFH